MENGYTVLDGRRLIVSEDALLDRSSKELCVKFSQQANVTSKVDQFIQNW